MYSPGQLRTIAYELARSGGNIRRAVRALKEEYETFDKVGESTVRRAREQKGFVELYEHFVERIDAARRQAEEEELEKKARIEVESSRAQDIAVLDVLQKRGKDVAKDLKPHHLAAYHVNLLRVIERRREPRSRDRQGAGSRKVAPSAEEPNIENI